MHEREVQLPAGGVRLRGTLAMPESTLAAVIFAHGSGSSRLSPRNREVAAAIQDAGIGTLLFDLLTPEEEAEDSYTGHLRFDIELLAGRLAEATDWLVNRADPRGLTVGSFGASTSAAATRMRGTRELIVVPRATHLFEEPGALEEVAALAVSWFHQYLVMDVAARPVRHDDRRRRPPAA